jgi:hypothetical protein
MKTQPAVKKSLNVDSVMQKLGPFLGLIIHRRHRISIKPELFRTVKYFKLVKTSRYSR